MSTGRSFSDDCQHLAFACRLVTHVSATINNQSNQTSFVICRHFLNFASFSKPPARFGSQRTCLRRKHAPNVGDSGLRLLPDCSRIQPCRSGNHRETTATMASMLVGLSQFNANKFELFHKRLNQVVSNRSAGATCGPLSYLIWPTVSFHQKLNTDGCHLGC